MEKIIVNCDGLCKPINPGGTATYGFVVKKGGEEIKEERGVIGKGWRMTNNVAEYTAVIQALAYLKREGLNEQKVVVRSDSVLLINQLNGSWRVHSSRILPLYREAKSWIRDFKDIRFEWVPRKKN